MREWRLILFLLMALGQGSWAQLPEHRSPTQALGGEITYAPEGQDETKITYQVGPIPEIENGDIHALEQATSALETFHQNLGDNFDVVVIREEGDTAELPEVLNRGGKRATIINVPKKLVQGLQKFWKGVHVKPTWASGIFVGTTKTAITASVYFSHLPIDSAIALSISTFVITTLTNTYSNTIDNLLIFGDKTTVAKTWKSMLKPKYFLSNLGYNIIMNNLYNEISLHRNSHEQTALNALASSPTSLFFNVQRQVLLAGKRHLTDAYSILLNPAVWVLQALETTGLVHPLFQIAGYQVRPTMVASLVIYAGLIVANAKAGKKVVALLENIHQKIERIQNFGINILSKATFGVCDRWLRGNNKTDSQELSVNSPHQ